MATQYNLVWIEPMKKGHKKLLIKHKCLSNGSKWQQFHLYSGRKNAWGKIPTDFCFHHERPAERESIVEKKEVYVSWEIDNA